MPRLGRAGARAAITREPALRAVLEAQPATPSRSRATITGTSSRSTNVSRQATGASPGSPASARVSRAR